MKHSTLSTATCRLCALVVIVIALGWAFGFTPKAFAANGLAAGEVADGQSLAPESTVTAGATGDDTDDQASQTAAKSKKTKKAKKTKPFKGKGIYYITLRKHPAKTLGMEDNARTDGIGVVVCKFRNTNLLKFRLIRAGGGFYYIKNVATGRLMSANMSDDPDPAVVMAKDRKKRFQKWSIVVNADKSVSFKNAKTKTRLELLDGKTAKGTELTLNRARNYRGQKFVLKKTKRNTKEKVRIGVPCTMQNPELPTGCESVALVNALNYWGAGMSKTSIANSWMPYGGNGVYNFIGNPRNSSGWIICAPGIANTANRVLKAKGFDVRAKVLKGKSLKSLRTYLDQGYPVIVWTTIGMGGPGRLVAYRSGYPLRYNNHAVVLTGYDPKTGKYQVADSLAGTVWRSGQRFTWLYNVMGKQAVVLHD